MISIIVTLTDGQDEKGHARWSLALNLKKFRKHSSRLIPQLRRPNRPDRLVCKTSIDCCEACQICTI